MAELACLAVHEDYRNAGRGDALLEYALESSLEQGLEAIFVLTTQASHWFRERGFNTLDMAKLPVKRRSLYNYSRNSRVYFLPISS
jgi:amino-acid N-acetyltransferase